MTGEDYVMSSFITQFDRSDQIKNDMGGAWRRVEVETRFWWGNLTERDYLDDLGVDWRIILKWIFMK